MTSLATGWRRLQQDLTGALVVVLLGWLAYGAWLRWQAVRVPVDWAGCWSGDRRLGADPRFVHRLVNARMVTVDNDAAYQCDGQAGADEFVELGHWQVGRKWTLAAWVRLESPPAAKPAWTSFAGCWGNSTQGYMVIGTKGLHPTAAFGPMGALEHLPGRLSLELKQWAHVAAMGSPEGVRVFVNGQLSAETTFEPTSPLATPPSDNLHLIGGRNDEPPCRRQIDDYAVYGRMLSAGEIARLHGAGRGGATRLAERLESWQALGSQALPWAAGLLTLLWGVPWLVRWWRRTFLRGSVGAVRTYAAVWVVLLVGAAVTAVVTQITAKWITAAAQYRVEGEARSLQGQLANHLTSLVGAMHTARDAIFARPQVTAEDWERGVDLVNLNTDFPAVMFTGFAELVRPEERPEHEARWRRLHGDRYRITPALPLAERNRYLAELTNTFLPIVFCRLGKLHALPQPARAGYLGRDLFALSDGDLTHTNSVLAHKLVGAVLGKQPRSTPPMVLDVEASDLPMDGLPIAIPVKWREAASGRNDARGVMFCVVSLERLFADAFRPRGLEDFRVRIALTDSGLSFPAFDSGKLWPPTVTSARPWLHHRWEGFFYQSRLSYELQTTPVFDRHLHRRAPWLVALAGAAITVLTGGFVAVQIRARLNEADNAGRLLAANADLARVQRERARLSRDLHDGTIQNLYALGLELGHARTLVTADPPRAEAELGHTLTTLQAAITELRQFVLELEPEAWQGQTVRNALESLVARLRRTTALEFHLSISPVADALPAKTAIHVLQLVREGLSNVLRHAEAQNVWVELGRRSRREEAHEALGTQIAGSASESQSLLTSAPTDGGGEWKLEISDDGRGFDAAAKASNGGRGLRSFRERATELGGQCEVHSTPGAGTRVVVVFPQLQDS